MGFEKVEQIGRHRSQCKSMYDLLKEYAGMGVSLSLGEVEAEPGQIAATCLREGVSYMMDYIPKDQDGQTIKQINFTRIDPEETGSEKTEKGCHPNIAILHCS